ncbi:pyridoxal 5'-phosphate synthase glutaminase subunit PdxT [Anaerobacillus sp. CMMVII]|uniref:pyridoxal 5'-phosphate synthase glutaminase subunit PdxT n=1 Tax=Anaerobacillus sp. CMMVII TaxID=2755588 RepID=UPI0021B7D3D1|nr:pyridoxal 5'-phosphate synthase glutaminase subunit PdxT [Anaerobacillus sp. CMMVII]MCT8136320.1 pyridoxal 5'-phosphate synthase glutaminase subunit PdxT [Anaerobacillus sp. CMMVII]
MVKIGVLALQGAVREHVQSLQSPDVEVVVVKKVEQLDDLDGLVLPGGESTAMRRLIDKYDFFEPLKAFANAGKPMFGTCAGLILMAKQLVGQNEGHLEIIDMEVERNAFGRQRESFEAELMVKGIAEDIMAVFIRAPLIKSVGDNVEILSKYKGEIVAVRQEQFLACSFHPELTSDARFHQYFVNIVKETKTKCLNV